MIAHINDQKDALLYRIYVGIERLRPWLTLSSDRRAASAMEYALMAALIGVCVVAAVGTLGSSLGEVHRDRHHAEGRRRGSTIAAANTG
ncbi:Flp family type IVb pilin [Siccirubricoccus deserti]